MTTGPYRQGHLENYNIYQRYKIHDLSFPVNESGHYLCTKGRLLGYLFPLDEYPVAQKRVLKPVRYNELHTSVYIPSIQLKTGAFK